MKEGVVSDQAPDPLGEELGAGLEERLARSLPRLRRHVARGRRVPGVEPDDVAQEVIARALRYRARFDPRRALWPWLKRLAQRVRADQAAAGARRHAPLSALEPGSSEPLARGDGGARVEEDDALVRLLAPLAPLEREILLRFHQRAQSVRAIAAALGLPEGTVKSHLSRARRRLAGLLGKEPPHA